MRIEITQHIDYTIDDFEGTAEEAVALVETGDWESQARSNVAYDRVQVYDDEDNVVSDTDETPYTWTPTKPSDPKLGDYVTTQVYGHRGRVTEVHHYNPQGAAWMSVQSDPRVREHASGRWVSILCEPRGAVVLPMALVDVVEPFPFTNTWGETYFHMETPEDSTLPERTWHHVDGDVCTSEVVYKDGDNDAGDEGVCDDHDRRVFYR